MANPNVFPVLLSLSLFVACHVQARESQFFSKFTANSDASPVVGASKEQMETLQKQAQAPPSFVAENQNGFGLYGHESGQLPTSDTASAARTTSFGDEPYYNKEAFATEDETADADSGAVNEQNNYVPGERYGNVVANGRNNYYAVGNRYEVVDGHNNHFPGESFTDAVEDGGNNYNAQQKPQLGEEQAEGMDDTRFVDNGKFSSYGNEEEKYDQTRFPASANAEFNTNQGGYYGDSYASTASEAGGYEPVKDMNDFRGTKPVDEKFIPWRFPGGIN